MKNSWIFIIIVIIPVSIQASKYKSLPGTVGVLGNNYTRKSDQKGSMVSKGPKGSTGLEKMSSDLKLAIFGLEPGHYCSNFLEPGVL